MVVFYVIYNSILMSCSKSFKNALSVIITEIIQKYALQKDFWTSSILYSIYNKKITYQNISDKISYEILRLCAFHIFW